MRRLDAQIALNPWLSLGVHLDHTDPSVTLHLPGVIVLAGWLEDGGLPGGWSLRQRGRTGVEDVTRVWREVD